MHARVRPRDAHCGETATEMLLASSRDSLLHISRACTRSFPKPEVHDVDMTKLLACSILRIQDQRFGDDLGLGQHTTLRS